MPFKSESQRKKFGELLKQGKITRAQFDEWNDATGNAKLPERVGDPTGPKMSTAGQGDGPAAQRRGSNRPGSRTAPSTRKRLRKGRKGR